jgi:hypothetical protein
LVVKFSERYGYKQIREIVQIDSIDEPLRNALWSLLKIHAWDHAHYTSGVYSGYYLSNESNSDLRVLCDRLWFNYFKKPLDQLDGKWTKVLEQLRTYFFQCEWYEVYDFIEFVVSNYKRYNFRDAFIQNCNAVLEKEVSAYRFVDGLISRITEQEQLEEIELALAKARGPVQMHLRRALELLSNREEPDYRNSIKESISAVEGLVIKTVGADKGTLGQLIKKLEDDIALHPALRTAFSSLYGYTNDEGGIRHAILESKTIGFEDAKFFLVICSAFVNYVEAKVATAG